MVASPSDAFLRLISAKPLWAPSKGWWHYLILRPHVQSLQPGPPGRAGLHLGWASGSGLGSRPREGHSPGTPSLSFLGHCYLLEERLCCNRCSLTAVPELSSLTQGTGDRIRKNTSVKG